MTTLYDIPVRTIDGHEQTLAPFQGKVLLIVNTASACGLLCTEAIKWNFTKFLVGRDGTVLKRYAPTDPPDAIRADLETALG